MYKILLGFLPLLIIGCSSIDYAKQDVACKNHGGVYTYTGKILIKVVCKDGTKQPWQEITGPEVTEALKLHQGTN